MENTGITSNNNNPKEKTTMRDIQNLLNKAASNKIQKNFSIKTSSPIVPSKKTFNSSNYNNFDSSKRKIEVPDNQKGSIFNPSSKKDNFVINRQNNNLNNKRINSIQIKPTNINNNARNNDQIFSTVANANLNTRKKGLDPEKLRAHKIQELLKRKQQLQERICKNEREIGVRTDKLADLEDEIQQRNEQIM